MVIVEIRDRRGLGSKFAVIASEPHCRRWRYEPACLFSEPANDNYRGFSDWLAQRHPRKLALACFVLSVLLGAGLATVMGAR